MVAPTAPTTQQSFVIGQFQTKNKSHWLRCFHQYLNQYLPFPTRFQPWAFLTHTYSTSIPRVVHESLGMQYPCYTTTSKSALKFSHTSSVGVIGRSQSILMHTSQYFHHIQFILFIFGKAMHFLHRNPW